MTARYIPQPGDWFEAYERGGTHYRICKNRLTGEKETVEINLVAGHKTVGGPFRCSRKNNSTIIAKHFHFWIEWYDFKKVEVKDPAPGANQGAG